MINISYSHGLWVELNPLKYKNSNVASIVKGEGRPPKSWQPKNKKEEKKNTEKKHALRQTSKIIS